MAGSYFVDCGNKILLEKDVLRAAEVMEYGGVIVYPTETLYGLGADPLNREAVERVFRIKNRPVGEGVSIAFGSIRDVERWVFISDYAKSVLEKYSPGPITVLVPHDLKVDVALPQSPLFGIRIPEHPVARQLVKACGPLISTSANRHGVASTEKEAFDVGLECDMCIGARGVAGTGSTVVSVVDETVSVIRPGPIVMEDESDN